MVANANGEVSITVTANDGQAQNNTFIQTFNIGVTPVNDPPVADAGPDQTADATSPAGASVTLNGTGSDVDGDVLIFYWSGPFGTAAGNTPTVTVPVGTHVITLTVADPAGATSTETVVVIVLSPAQMTSNLINAVMSANFQQGSALLQIALGSLNSGNTGASCNQIDAFIKQVQNDSGKKLSVAEANQLIASANQVKAAMGCSSHGANTTSLIFFDSKENAEIVTEIVTEYALYPAYPNPFNPTTTIEYQVPVSGLVKLSVFDILGGEIGVLVDENKSAGRYKARFDGSNLTAGIYFYRMQAGHFQETRKLVLLK